METPKTYESFIFRASWWQNIKNLPDEYRVKVFDDMCQYVFEGVEPEFDAMSAPSMAFHFIKDDIDSDKVKYDEVRNKRSEAGKAGNAKRWGQSQNVANIANVANATNAKTSESQNVANIANVADNDNVYVCVNDNEKSEKQKDKSFSFSEKKEKIIFDFSMILLSEGRPNAYAEACEAYEYNESTGWTTETTKPNGDIQRKKIANPLSWLQGWKRKNEQIFAPADGMLFADILKQSGQINPKNACIINDFRGLRKTSEEEVAFMFSRRTSFVPFAKAIQENNTFNRRVFTELLKTYPNVTSCTCKVI